MLQKLVMHSRAIAHHQELRCCSLAKIPMILLTLNRSEATRWLSWYGVGLASADRLPVVVRIPAGPLGSLKCDPPKGNGRRPQKRAQNRSGDYLPPARLAKLIALL